MPVNHVSFFTHHALKLSADLYLPESLDPHKKYPAIVLCQGLSGVKSKVLPEIAQAFSAKGYIVLAFSYRGCGDSEGIKTELFPEARVDEVLHAIGYMRSLAAVDPERIALYGISYGGGIALVAASRDEQIRCVVSVSGAMDGVALMRGLRTTAAWLDFKALLEQDQIHRAVSGTSELISLLDLFPLGEKFWAAYAKLSNPSESESLPENTQTRDNSVQFTLESAEAIKQFNLLGSLPLLAAKPILMIHGTADSIVAIEEVLAIYRKIPGIKNFIRVPHADHIDLDHDPILLDAIQNALDWFQSYL